jgi:hypothetical protein
MPWNYMAATQVSAMSREITVSDHMKDHTTAAAVKRTDLG